ncbi:MAG: carbohydrate-binding domain-containing protein [Bacteroidaceae bacterium]|nr:carbohydrate-binding domain-containing protein [Bacteroidaceae bacterium]
MKKVLLSALMLIGLSNASAQRYMRIWQGGESNREALQEIKFSNQGTRITAAEESYQTNEVDSITIVKQVYVTFNGNTATVDLGNSTDITYEVDGAHVTLTNTNVTEEMEVELSGSSTNGSFTYNGAYKCKIHLNGLNLTSTRGAAINIQNGKRIDLILKDGTTNTLVDAANGEQKACLYCKGHLEISGGGNLNVTGNTRHAIGTNEYLLLKRTTGKITITKAVGDAIHAGQYFQMNGGTLDISGMGGDGIQAEITNDATDEMNGEVIIKGGSITMTVATVDTKGIKSDTNFTINGGTFNITASANGSKGMSAGTNMFINEDDNPTNITIKATGSKYTDPVTKESSRCMGIRVVDDLTITAGTITVSTTYSSARAIKVGGTYYAKGGTVTGEVDATAIVK